MDIRICLSTGYRQLMLRKYILNAWDHSTGILSALSETEKPDFNMIASLSPSIPEAVTTNSMLVGVRASPQPLSDGDAKERMKTSGKSDLRLV